MDTLYVCGNPKCDEYLCVYDSSADCRCGHPRQAIKVKQHVLERKLSRFDGREKIERDDIERGLQFEPTLEFIRNAISAVNFNI